MDHKMSDDLEEDYEQAKEELDNLTSPVKNKIEGKIKDTIKDKLNGSKNSSEATNTTAPKSATGPKSAGGSSPASSGVSGGTTAAPGAQGVGAGGTAASATTGGGAAAGTGAGAAAAGGAGGAAAGAGGAAAGGAGAAAAGVGIGAAAPWILLALLIILLIVIIVLVLFLPVCGNPLTMLNAENGVQDLQTSLNDPNNWTQVYNKMSPEAQYALIYQNVSNELQEGAKIIVDNFNETFFHTSHIPKPPTQCNSPHYGYDDYISGKNPESCPSHDDFLKWACDSSYTSSRIRSETSGFMVNPVQFSNICNCNAERCFSPFWMTTDFCTYVTEFQRPFAAGEEFKKVDCWTQGFDHYVLTEDTPDDWTKQNHEPNYTAVYRLNPEMTFMANYEILSVLANESDDGAKFTKYGTVDNMVSYISAATSVATCDISPDAGYKYFLKKTINRKLIKLALNSENLEDENNMSNAFFKIQQWGDYAEGAEIPVDHAGNPIPFKNLIKDSMEDCYTNPDPLTGFKDYYLRPGIDVEFKVISVLNENLCTFIPMEGTEYIGKDGITYGEYYFLISNPLDTDVLTYALLTSDYAKTQVSTFWLFFGITTAKGMGSYYDAYELFEPKYTVSENLKNFIVPDYIVKISKREDINRYLYGVNPYYYINNKKPKEQKHFQTLWNKHFNSEDKDKEKNVLMRAYMSDKNGDGKVNGYDFYGLMNEYYYTFNTRVRYRCASDDDAKGGCNLLHNGIDIETPCLAHKLTGYDENCKYCLKKSDPEAEDSFSHDNCLEWGKRYPVLCPGSTDGRAIYTSYDEDGKLTADINESIEGAEGVCGAFPQMVLWGFTSMETVKSPEPEFRNFVAMDVPMGSDSDDIKEIFDSLGNLSGSGTGKVVYKDDKTIDLTKNYNRLNYSNNKAGSLDNKYYVTFDEAQMKYMYKVDDQYQNENKDATTGFENIGDDGVSDLIEVSVDLDVKNAFLEQEEKTLKFYKDRYSEQFKTEGSVITDVKALTVESAIFEKKFWFQNGLMMDSYNDGLYGNVDSMGRDHSYTMSGTNVHTNESGQIEEVTPEYTKNGEHDKNGQYDIYVEQYTPDKFSDADNSDLTRIDNTNDSSYLNDIPK